MKIDREDFSNIVDLALSEGTTTHLRAVIEKELLHYDICLHLKETAF